MAAYEFTPERYYRRPTLLAIGRKKTNNIPILAVVASIAAAGIVMGSLYALHRYRPRLSFAVRQTPVVHNPKQFVTRVSAPPKVQPVAKTVNPRKYIVAVRPSIPESSDSESGTENPMFTGNMPYTMSKERYMERRKHTND